ncbi:hypothetical protein BDW02DRAFT_502139 [Decorospora gaudefroyi]|uniref:DUF7607 domain-containing protein n=1 Tax=Decorospora gaudefroyi TaxID=184978 RepID=A0A6A5K534_9PLEO|nr:hypothetical protein BDW02DRAFT_502139 [Decorospora gaudefroyi]
MSITSVDFEGRKRMKVTQLSKTPLPVAPGHSEGPIASTFGPLSETEPSGTENWEYLLRWQNVAGGDQELDLAAEDDIEDDQYGLEDAAEEDAQDVPDDNDKGTEGVGGKSKLSKDQVLDIINERIEFYANSWVPNKGVAREDEVQYDPFTMWEEAEASGKRQELVQKYETNYAYYSHRLDRLCDGIVLFPGSNADQVRRQCGNLEITIDSMELAGWLRDIYKLEPAEDSDEERELDRPDTTKDEPTSQHKFSAHQLKAPIQIIDLGSPSEPSEIGDGNASPFDRPAEAATQMAGDRLDAPIRFSTPDSVIVNSVEPPLPDCLSIEHTVPVRKPINHGDEPENASIATVGRWRWTDLAENQDRKRVVSKAIHEMKVQDRELIRNRIRYVGKPSLVKEMGACVEMLRRGESKLQGVLPRDMPKIITFTNLFLSWWFCRNYTRQQGASRRDLGELKQCMEDGSAETGIFYDYVSTVMGTTFSPQALQHPERPSQAEIIEISDDDD